MDDQAQARWVIRATGAIGSYPAGGFPAGTLLVLEEPRQVWLCATPGAGTRAWWFVGSLDVAQRTTRTVAGFAVAADGATVQAGRFVFDPATFPPGFALRLVCTLSATAGTATVQLWSYAAGRYVAIGPGDQIGTTGTDPAEVQSVDLATGSVAGFSMLAPGAYRIDLTSDALGHVAELGLAELVTRWG